MRRHCIRAAARPVCPVLSHPPITLDDMDARLNVVDFATYRLARDLRRPQPEAEPEPGPRPLHGPGRAVDMLTERAVKHRARMLQHLSGS